MDSPNPSGMIVPNPGPPKTIGILNIVFGGLMSLCGIGLMLQMLFMPVIGRFFETRQKQAVAQAERAQRDAIKAQLDELTAREKSAQTDVEKAEIEAERKALQNRPKPYVPNMAMGLNMMSDPVVIRYTWGDYISGLVLNVAMIVSGIGLVRLKPWGRSLALWVAGLKIVRCLILAGFGIMVLAPVMTKQIGKEFDNVGQQVGAQKGNPQAAAGVQQQMKTMKGFMGVMMAVSYGGTYLSYTIYPIIVLVVLTRPRVKAACLAWEKPEADPFQ